MSLRTRLVISFTVLLLVVIAAVGVVASRAVQRIQIAQTDRVLTSFVERGPGQFQVPLPGPAPGQGEAFLTSIAEVVVDQDGNVLASRPSGFSDDPDPLPDVSSLPDTDEPFNLPSVDGSMEYRAIVVTAPEEVTAPQVLSFVRAASLAAADEATATLIRNLVLAGTVVLVIGSITTWWTVKRAMRPVDLMVDTAEAIASGDMSRRVPDLEPGTELGRLGGSLNEMLAHIEQAVAAEREGQERLRQFIADASHELRTPVTAISGYAELRRSGGLVTPEEEDRAWSRIESEGNRMGSLVADLLALTRLDQGTPLHLSEFDLVDVAHNAADDHRVIDTDRPISVTAPGSVVIEADEDRVHQAITSLLSNVRVHTPPGTRVEIGIAEHDGAAVIEVSDNGPGFPAASIDHVFDRFYRADPSRSRRSGGSGLGLAIVAAIVSAHGGTARVSNVEASGAKVTLTLPVRPPVPAAL